MCCNKIGNVRGVSGRQSRDKGNLLNTVLHYHMIHTMISICERLNRQNLFGF